MELLGTERGERLPMVERLRHRGSEPVRRAARRIRRTRRHREERGAASRTRRGTRDRVVDTGAFLFAGCFLVLTADSVVIDSGTSETALFLDQLTGALSCAAGSCGVGNRCRSPSDCCSWSPSRTSSPDRSWWRCSPSRSTSRPA